MLNFDVWRGFFSIIGGRGLPLILFRVTCYFREFDEIMSTKAIDSTRTFVS